MYHRPHTQHESFGYIVDLFMNEKKTLGHVGYHAYEHYINCFRHLVSFGFNLTDPSTITLPQFKRFLIEFSTERKWRPPTFNTYLKVYRAFFAWCIENGFLTENIARKVSVQRIEKRIPKSLSEDQVKEVFRVLPLIWKSPSLIDARNRLLVLTALYTGMRMMEIATLKLEHIDLKNRIITVSLGKGGRDRKVPIVKELLSEITAYLSLRKRVSEEIPWLFVSKFGSHLKDRDMSVLIQKLRYHLPFHVHWHGFRHTFATNLVQRNFDIYNVSKLLGHSDLKMTQIYLSSDTKKLYQQLNALGVYERKRTAF